MKFCVTARFYGKTFISQKLGNWAKKTFLNLKKKLRIHFNLIFSIMKIYIICGVPAQILYLGKILFVRYRPKCSKPFRLQDF